MIVEYIRYQIPEGNQPSFEDAYTKAATSLEASAHCLSYELSHGVEEPENYILRIEWDSQEGHERGFRRSPEFKTFFSAVKPFFDNIQEMRHYEATDVRSSDETPWRSRLEGDDVMSASDRTKAMIRVTRDGPYRIEGSMTVTDASGQLVCEEGTRYLCRCGGSQNKPLCDGTHGKNSFDGTETADHNRIENRREILTGQGVTIFDDRSRCAHIGRCTDGLPAVFRLGQEPWIDAAAASAEEVAAVVRLCPSGALAYALGTGPDLEPTEEPTDPVIIALPDASLQIRGGVPVVAADGEPYEIRARQTLCRCGHSQNKPFCDGSHWSAGFRDPTEERDFSIPTVFEWAGGSEAFERLVSVFYSRLLQERDELLYPIFRHMGSEHVPHVAAWLIETFGGSRRYTEELGGYERMLAKHRNLELTEAQRKRWVQRIGEAVDEAGLPADPEFRSAFLAYIEWGTRIAVANSQTDAAPPEHAPIPQWGWGEAPPYVPARLQGAQPLNELNPEEEK